MTKKPDQDALLIRYLLGEATEDEQSRLEEEFFVDDERYQHLLAIEDELRYEYAQGGLSSHQRASFEKRFLKTAQDWEKVAMARAVLTQAFAAQKEASVMAAAGEESQGWWRSVLNMLTPGSRMRLSYAGAVLALIAVSGGSWLALQNLQLRQQVGDLQAERKNAGRNAENQIAAARAQQDSLNQSLTEEQAKRKELEKKLSSGQNTFLSFALAPGLVRDADGLKRLAVPVGTSEIRLQLGVKSSGYRSYRAELQTLDGDVIWSQNLTQPVLAIPSRLVEPGDFMVALKGISATGESTDLGEYYFEIVRK